MASKVFALENKAQPWTKATGDQRLMASKVFARTGGSGGKPDLKVINA